MCLYFDTIKDTKRWKKGYKIFHLTLPNICDSDNMDHAVKDASLLSPINNTCRVYRLCETYVDSKHVSPMDDSGYMYRLFDRGTYIFPKVQSKYNYENKTLGPGAYHYYRNKSFAKNSFIYEVPAIQESRATRNQVQLSVLCKCYFTGRLYYRREMILNYLTRYISYIWNFGTKNLLHYNPLKNDECCSAAGTVMYIDTIVDFNSSSFTNIDKEQLEYFKMYINKINKYYKDNGTKRAKRFFCD